MKIHSHIWIVAAALVGGLAPLAKAAPALEPRQVWLNEVAPMMQRVTGNPVDKEEYGTGDLSFIISARWLGTAGCTDIVVVAVFNRSGPKNLFATPDSLRSSVVEVARVIEKTRYLRHFFWITTQPPDNLSLPLTLPGAIPGHLLGSRDKDTRVVDGMDYACWSACAYATPAEDRMWIVLARVFAPRPLDAPPPEGYQATIGSQSREAATEALKALLPRSELKFFDANPLFNDGIDITNPRKRDERTRGVDQAATVRQKVAADGVSALLVRCPVPRVGSAKIAILGGATDGTLLPLCSDLAKEKGEAELTVQSLPAGTGYYLACLYRPPDHMGGNGRDRSVILQAEYKSADDNASSGKSNLTFQGTVTLTRPPVVLVHGTFDNPEYCWNSNAVKECRGTLRNALLAQGFTVLMVDWQASNGQYDPSSFLHNRNAVWANPGGISNAIASMRATGVAVTQADLVCHSQGGVIARVYAAGNYDQGRSEGDLHFTDQRTCGVLCSYHRPDNYCAGDIHRLITISTTHFGSDICQIFEQYRLLWEDGKYDDGGSQWPFDRIGLFLLLCFHPSRDSAASMIMRGLEQNDRKIYEGLEYQLTEGVRDQTPGSKAYQKIGPTRIPSHAIACLATDQTMLDHSDGFYQKRMDLVWKLSPARLIRDTFNRLAQTRDAADLYRLKQEEADLEEEAGLTGVTDPDFTIGDQGARSAAWQKLKAVRLRNSARFRSAVFGNTPNDCTVRQSSSFGGLAPMYTTRITNVLHGSAPQYPEVQQRVLELLTNNGSLFCPEGFPPSAVPGNLDYLPQDAGSGPNAPIPQGTGGNTPVGTAHKSTLQEKQRPDPQPLLKGSADKGSSLAAPMDIKNRVVRPGDRLIVRINTPPPGKYAWIGFYKTGASDKEYIKYIYLYGIDNNTYEDVIAPDELGTYNFRLFKDESYVPVAVSESVEVR